MMPIYFCIRASCEDGSSLLPPPDVDVVLVRITV
jgi:hypothetical protein